MKDWQAYSQTKAQSSGVSGAKPPSVIEYACIRLIDSGALAVLVGLIILFAFAGGMLNIYGTNAGVQVVAGWCFDAAKLCLGVFLGVWSQRKRR